MRHPQPPSILRPSRAATALVAIVLAIAACSTSGSPGLGGSGTAGAGRLRVVTTTTVFADLVRQVGGDLVEVTSLVPRDGDVHTFEPKPADIARVAGARLLVMNGLGLDDWLEKIFTNAAAAGTPLVKLAVGLPGVRLLPGDTPSTQNPHLWMDVAYAKRYVERIAGALESVDPNNATRYSAQASAYEQRLDSVDAGVRARIATIPAADRKLVTFHDAFPYYARAYGITIVGVAVAAPGQDPSAAYTARLIEAIKAAGVKAIFSERQFPTRLVDAIAGQTGARVVSDLYDDALGDQVSSYETLMTWDTDQLVKALS